MLSANDSGFRVLTAGEIDLVGGGGSTQKPVYEEEIVVTGTRDGGGNSDGGARDYESSAAESFFQNNCNPPDPTDEPKTIVCAIAAFSVLMSQAPEIGVDDGRTNAMGDRY